MQSGSPRPQIPPKIMTSTNNTPENLANKVKNAAELLAALEIPTQTNYAHYDTLISPEEWPAFRAELLAAGLEVRTETDTPGQGTIKLFIEKLAGLVVPGVSELIFYLHVTSWHDWRDGGKGCRVESVQPYLIMNNRAYCLDAWEYDKTGKTYRLFLPDSKTLYEARLAGFKSPEMPKRVNKATAKKLAAWVDYLDGENAAAVAYIKRGTDAADSLLNELDAAGVEYKRDGQTITIYNGPFSMVAELCKTGVYFREPVAKLGKHLKEAAAIRPDLDSRLAFMLNAKINITF